MHPSGRQDVPETNIRVPRYHLVRSRYRSGHEVKYGKERFCSIRGNGQVINIVCGPLQFLPHGVIGRVVVHFRRQVVARCQVLEPVKVVPVTCPTSAGVSVHHLKWKFPVN